MYYQQLIKTAPSKPPRAPLRALPSPILRGLSRPRCAWLRGALAGPLRPAGEVGAAAGGRRRWGGAKRAFAFPIRFGFLTGRVLFWFPIV
jgi:hypothetical protein